MLLTSIGSDYFPKSSEGRILCLLLAIYGFAVFGYMTATLASFFLERDVDSAAASSEVKAELAEIRRLILDARSVKELDA
jgi:voltage-gated potassium channel